MAQTINLILETRDDREISARSTDFPDCVAAAETREEAIALMKQQLNDRMQAIEVGISGLSNGHNVSPIGSHFLL